ncbi:MAG: beta-galactosidase [Armatimonadota bacterium]
MKYLFALVPLIAVIISSTVYAADASANMLKSRSCITDPQRYYFDSEENIRKRFELYKANGVDMIRMEVDWAVLEQQEGNWQPGKVCEYLKLAKEYGFRIKLIVGVMMAPPSWYLDKYPEAMLTDQNGGHSRNTMSYWYPDLKKVIDQKTKQIFETLNEIDVWDSVDYLIPTFGPAGEPIYPHPWTLGPAFPDVTFWGYDVNAQKDFRMRMRQKYKLLDKANSAWGTDFKSWNEVKVLLPKTQPGAYWNDMLTWYRDSKRRYIDWQVENTKKYVGKDKKVLMYVPGTGYSDQDWADAVKTGDGNVWIKLMADSMYLIDVAAKKGCWLQYTGVENAPEVERLRKYLDDHKYSKVEMWGENAGYYDYAKDPVLLADIIIKNRLYGLDLTHAHFMLEGDDITPNANMPELKKAYQMIRAYWAGK